MLESISKEVDKSWVKLLCNVIKLAIMRRGTFLAFSENYIYLEIKEAVLQLILRN